MPAKKKERTTTKKSVSKNARPNTIGFGIDDRLKHISKTETSKGKASPRAFKEYVKLKKTKKKK